MLVLLSGCGMTLFDPKGDIGVQEKTLIVVSLGIMLAVVVPVIVLTLWFAWRYRETNTQAVYAPKWAHSTRIEVVVWGVPCVIVAFLAVLIWRTTHSLDPYKPLVSEVAPLRVEVVAMNWKWLFIYPDYGVASVNQLAVPVDTPIAFKLTAHSLMNSFFIPQLGSQIYAMPGMQTQLHLIANHAGAYDGMSAAYSGHGFSGMNFKASAMSRGDFDGWVAQARKSSETLSMDTYRKLEVPSVKTPPATYAQVENGLFSAILNQYMSMSVEDMAANDICGPSTPEFPLRLQAARPTMPSTPLSTTLPQAAVSTTTSMQGGE
ncbi:ubiquinol oxidase subunit II [Variovorax sp. KBW07]|uniref:ubiquinol oxidase subunit II n=1 Tax=Variovorax sp. KBW07 TaxID=2153358 RepID=UPI0021AAB9FC|nr:ubiquinol oxidase subunit II [Variovorax sp. KBW07]